MKAIFGVDIICHPEDLPVRGNAIASGDDAYDKQVEDEILERLSRGDAWAWCTVEVKVTIDGVSTSEYLGGCSYDNEYAFESAGDYYPDMVLTCLDKLAAIGKVAEVEAEKRKGGKS
jgi:hypothetical protein